MNNCVECVFRGTTELDKGKFRYSGLEDKSVWIEDRRVVNSCSKSPGMPLEIPVDRLACSDWKDRKGES